jgi:hypothetical protein
MAAIPQDRARVGRQSSAHGRLSRHPRDSTVYLHSELTTSCACIAGYATAIPSASVAWMLATYPVVHRTPVSSPGARFTRKCPALGFPWNHHSTFAAVTSSADRSRASDAKDCALARHMCRDAIREGAMKLPVCNSHVEGRTRASCLPTIIPLNGPSCTRLPCTDRAPVTQKQPRS